MARGKQWPAFPRGILTAHRCIPCGLRRFDPRAGRLKLTGSDDRGRADGLDNITRPRYSGNEGQGQGRTRILEPRERMQAGGLDKRRRRIQAEKRPQTGLNGLAAK